MSTDKREALMAQAKELGVKVHHMAGEQKIQDAIDAHLAESAESESAANNFGAPVNKNQIDKETGKIVPLTAEQYRASTAPDRKKTLNRLVRCRITCMNPAKRAWPGEIISVGSAKNGTFKKYIPFDGREWHIPNVIFEELKSRKYSHFYSVRDSRGHETRKGRLMDEFSIDVLPPLTPSERQKLVKEQALANNQ
jgi:hypothetical protein